MESPVIGGDATDVDEGARARAPGRCECKVRTVSFSPCAEARDAAPRKSRKRARR